MNCKCNRISNECKPPPVQRDGEGKPLAGNSPFAVGALVSRGWEFSRASTKSASRSSCPRLVKWSSVVPRLPSCLLTASPARPPWILTFGLTPGTFQAYFCLLAWLSDLSLTLFQSHSLFQQTVTYMPIEMVTTGALWQRCHVCLGI